MLVVIPGDVGLFEVPQAGDDEDDEEDDDPTVNGVVETRPLGVLCRLLGEVLRRYAYTTEKPRFIEEMQPCNQTCPDAKNGGRFSFVQKDNHRCEVCGNKCTS